MERVYKLVHGLLNETRKARSREEKIQSLRRLTNIRRHGQLGSLFCGGTSNCNNRTCTRPEHELLVDAAQENMEESYDDADNAVSFSSSILWKEVATVLLKYEGDDDNDDDDVDHSNASLESNDMDDCKYTLAIISLCGCTPTLLAAIELLKSISVRNDDRTKGMVNDTICIRNSSSSARLTVKLSMKCIEQILFPVSTNDQDCYNRNNDDECWMIDVSDTILRIPMLISNACCATEMSVKVPAWSTQKYYYPRMVRVAVERQILVMERRNENIPSDKLQESFYTLIQQIVRNRGGDDVVLGFYQYYCSQRDLLRKGENKSSSHERRLMDKYEMNESHPTIESTTINKDVLQRILTTLIGKYLIPREAAVLIRSFLRHIVSLDRPYATTNIKKKGLTTRIEMIDWIDCTCCSMIASSSRIVCDTLIRLVVMSSSSVCLNKRYPNNENHGNENAVDIRICQLLTQILFRVGIRQNQWKFVSGNHESNQSNPSLTNPACDDSDSDSEGEGDAIGESDNNPNSHSCRLEETQQEDQETSLLRRYLTEVASIWSQPCFTKQTESNLQHHVSGFLWYGFLILSKRNFSVLEKERLVTSELVSYVLNGVTCRLGSGISKLRTDGMLVAEILADVLGHETFRFDENGRQLRLPENDFCGLYENSINNRTMNTVSTSNAGDNFSTIPEKQKNSIPNSDELKRYEPTIHSTTAADTYTLDAVSDEEVKRNRAAASVTSKDSVNDDSIHDDDSVWDDMAYPNANNFDSAPMYDIDDDEDDLRATPRPLYLIECLDLLRTPEGDENACSRHLTALHEIPKLVRLQPADLLDVGPELAVQLLRMENKFSIEYFADLISNALVVLNVEEPISVGNTMIEQFFRDGSLCDRLNVLQSLARAAMEISCGPTSTSAKYIHSQTSKINSTRNEIQTGTHDGGMAGSSDFDHVSGKLHLVSSIHVEKSDIVGKITHNDINAYPGRSTRTHRRGNTKLEHEKAGNYSKQRNINNKFVAIGPIWFYSLIGHFVEHKDETALWGGQVGATLLVNFLLTLSCIVECCGGQYHHQTSQLLAKDLFQFSWTFCNAEVAEVRSAVLVSVATALDALREDEVIAILFGDSSTNDSTSTHTKTLHHHHNHARTIEQMAVSDPDEHCRELSVFLSKKIISCLHVLMD